MHFLLLKATAECLMQLLGAQGLIYREPDPSHHITDMGAGGALPEHRSQLSPTSLCWAVRRNKSSGRKGTHHRCPRVGHPRAASFHTASTNNLSINLPKVWTNPLFPPYLCAGSASPDPAPILVQALKKDPSLENIKLEKEAALSPRHRLHIAYIK